MKKTWIIISLFIVTNSLVAQDTIKVMHYNLLYYGYSFGACNATNNKIDDKNDYLKTIFTYHLPDIFTVNEIYCNSNVCQILLDDALNEYGISYYQRADISCQSQEHKISNMLYYNSQKLGLHSQSYVGTNVRDIDIYKLYHKGSLMLNSDTIFLYCIVAHLKAGSGSGDEYKRTLMVDNLMNHISNNKEPGNYLFMGDFNIYYSSEQAFQKMINWGEAAYRFYDPINRIGGWHNNSSYSDIHTQSTHTSVNTCPVPGGMDDRFDFILISKDIRDGSKKIKYIPDTYEAIGQDGKHFNKAINSSPTNTSVPADVLSALYNNSDHLPVYCELFVGEQAGIGDLSNGYFDMEVFPNPTDSEFWVQSSEFGVSGCELKVSDIAGRVITSLLILKGQTKVKINSTSWPKGLYLIQAKSKNGLSNLYKMVVK